MWIDTHCHLDAPEFAPDLGAVVQRARAAGVSRWVLPAVQADDFAKVHELGHHLGAAYALGIHPLYVDRADDADLDRLQAALHARRDDPRLVAVGEIGLDHFVPGLDRALQQRFYLAQLKLARDAGLPVISWSAMEMGPAPPSWMATSTATIASRERPCGTSLRKPP